jgi:hypothetical protein
MRRGIAHPHNSGHWRARRRGLAAPWRTEREHAQRVGEGDTMVINTTLTLQSSTLRDKSEDRLGSGVPWDDGSTFPPGAHRPSRNPPSFVVACQGGKPARPLNSFFSFICFCVECLHSLSVMVSRSLSFLFFLLVHRYLSEKC